MSKSRLQNLRNELTRLQSARRTVTLGLFVSHLLLISGGVLVLFFLLDFVLELSVLQRLIVATLGVVAVVWGCAQVGCDWNSFRTSILDLALGVERRHGIEGDLVAALQFEEGKATGSPQLQSAVIEYVSQLNRDIDVFAGFDASPLKRRLASVAAMLLAMLVGYFLLPGHFQTFLSRLALADQPYPTQTQIEHLHVNGQEIIWPETRLASSEPPEVVVGYGKPVSFEVLCGGVLPSVCQMILRDQAGERTPLEMSPSADKAGQFSLDLPRLIETVDLWVEAGDAHSRMARLRLIPLPLLEIELEVTPPGYASPGNEKLVFNTPNISVLEGSRALLTVKADRPLEQVEIEIMRMGQPDKLRLEAVDSERQIWRLAGSENPLNDLREPLTYKLTAVDQHGLNPQGTPRGTIRVMTDKAPRAIASMIHKVLLPGAKPQLRLKIDDDFGLASAHLEMRVERNMETVLEERVSLNQELGLAPGQTTLEKSHALALSRWKLQPGDRLQITLAAEDNRGGQPGRIGRSEPLVLEIADESGVLAAISEADQQSEQLLGELIQRQLGIGETQ
ncbi:MAG: hypothetical protein WDZ51_08255 [Pirellulaceae bacterium]